VGLLGRTVRGSGGLRHILIHEYFGVDAEIVWDFVQNKLEVLERLAEEIAGE